MKYTDNTQSLLHYLYFHGLCHGLREVKILREVVRHNGNPCSHRFSVSNKYTWLRWLPVEDDLPFTSLLPESHGTSEFEWTCHHDINSTFLEPPNSNCSRWTYRYRHRSTSPPTGDRHRASKSLIDLRITFYRSPPIVTPSTGSEDGGLSSDYKSFFYSSSVKGYGWGWRVGIVKSRIQDLSLSLSTLRDELVNDRYSGTLSLT